MPSCNPPSLKPLWQILQAGHDCKLFLRQGQFKWPGDVTWGDLGSKISHVVQNWCAKSCAKRHGATRRGFIVMRKKKRERVVTCPPPLGQRLDEHGWICRMTYSGQVVALIWGNDVIFSKKWEPITNRYQNERSWNPNTKPTFHQPKYFNFLLILKTSYTDFVG